MCPFISVLTGVGNLDNFSAPVNMFGNSRYNFFPFLTFCKQGARTSPMLSFVLRWFPPSRITRPSKPSPQYLMSKTKSTLPVSQGQTDLSPPLQAVPLGVASPLSISSPQSVVKTESGSKVDCNGVVSRTGGDVELCHIPSYDRTTRQNNR